MRCKIKKGNNPYKLLLSVWRATIRKSHPLGRNLSWNHSSAFWNWLHIGLGARCAGKEWTASVRLSELTSASWRVFHLVSACSAGNSTLSIFPCLFLYYMLFFSQTTACLFVSFWRDIQCGGLQKTCCLATMILVKSDLFTVWFASVFVQVCQAASVLKQT